eukprot:TRINITY_DN17980_c0_g1_i1.p1 TRINITY_DN17980_c0_g1~~TRINITY_DN17980_c0_g1_i1.p1  ORF type:complete len:446 (+),score=36.94 TRINITY_DN17980_c0_g1_i1:122-1459(+)
MACYLGWSLGLLMMADVIWRQSGRVKDLKSSVRKLVQGIGDGFSERSLYEAQIEDGMFHARCENIMFFATWAPNVLVITMVIHLQALELPLTFPLMTVALYVAMRAIASGTLKLNKGILKGCSACWYACCIHRALCCPDFVMGMSIRIVLRICMGLAALDFKCSCFWNLCIAIANIARFSQCDELFGGSLPSQAQIKRYAFTEFATTVFIAVVLKMVERYMEQRIISQCKELESQQSEKAARKLLSVMCDADVLLDTSLRPTGTINKFSHLVMPQHNTHESGMNVCFTQWIETADQPAFLNMMERCKTLGDCGPAESLHVDMKDGTGRKFPAELFHVALRAPYVDEIKHLIGIKTLQDERTFQNSGLVSLPETHAVERVCTPKLRSRLPNSRIPRERPSESRLEQYLRNEQSRRAKQDGRALETRRTNSPAASSRASAYSSSFRS